MKNEQTMKLVEILLWHTSIGINPMVVDQPAEGRQLARVKKQFYQGHNVISVYRLVCRVIRRESVDIANSFFIANLPA